MYVALDIETTSTDPDNGQVLEVAAVIDDRSKPVMDCPYFRQVVRQTQIVGQPRALYMNARLLEIIANGGGVREQDLNHQLFTWLAKNLGMPGFDYWIARPNSTPVITFVGKNVGSFDKLFLKKLPGWPNRMVNYRSLDIGSLYASHERIPSLKDLLPLVNEKLAGEPHEALYDARAALALARAMWGLDY